MRLVMFFNPKRNYFSNSKRQINSLIDFKKNSNILVYNRPVPISKYKYMKKELPAWLAYLTPVGWLILWIEYKRSGSRSTIVLLHLRQMIGLMILLVMVWMLQAIYIYSKRVNYIATPAYFLLFFLWLMGLSDAIRNKAKPLPIIGRIIQQALLFIN
jgi:hypothetical protein